MDNYSKIKLMLEHGFKVKCQLGVRTVGRPSENWIIFTSISSDGRLRLSNDSSELTDCLDTLGVHSENEAGINALNLTSITPIIEKPKMYQVGDLVDIAEEWSKDRDWVEKKYGTTKKMIVDGYSPDDQLVYLSKDKERICQVPNWAVTPHIPEQDDEVAKAIKSKMIGIDSLIFFLEKDVLSRGEYYGYENGIKTVIEKLKNIRENN